MKTIFTILPILFILISNIETVKSQDYKTSEFNYSDSLTLELDELYKKGFIYGFSVAIVNEKEILYNKGFGYSNIDLKKGYETNTIQNIASVSKTLIGISLLKAQEQGYLLLDDPINKYLPFKVINPYFSNDKITIRHLATHTSAILDTDYYDKISYVINDNTKIINDTTNKFGVTLNNPDSELSMGDFLKKLLSVNGEWIDSTNYLKEKPGSKYEYSNVGAALAALVLEYATGTSYTEYSRKYILNPLKMNNSGWTEKNVNILNHSVLYLSNGDPIPLYHLVTYPDGGLISSTSDLAIYLIELIKGFNGDGELLKSDSYKQLFTEQLTAEHYHDRGDNSYDDEYNSGIFMGFTPDGYVGHTGADPGTIVYMFFNPRNKIGRILMINTWLATEESANQFYSIWNKLGKYEKNLNE